jgi:hypothetical protein
MCNDDNSTKNTKQKTKRTCLVSYSRTIALMMTTTTFGGKQSGWYALPRLGMQIAIQAETSKVTKCSRKHVCTWQERFFMIWIENQVWK